jgi:hypothetical protein
VFVVEPAHSTADLGRHGTVDQNASNHFLLRKFSHTNLHRHTAQSQDLNQNTISTLIYFFSS